MFGPSVPLLHNGRFTVYAQRVGQGVKLTLVGEEVPAIPEQKDAGGRVTVAAAKKLPELIEESASGAFKNKDHPFSQKQIEKELKSLPGPVGSPAAEVKTQ